LHQGQVNRVSAEEEGEVPGGLRTLDSMPLPASEDQGLTMTCYSAEPGSPSDDALKVLASWSASTPGSPSESLGAGEQAR
jgi:hypothetical protein